MNVRLRRLEADWLAVREALRDHPNVQIVGTAGKPPQRYHLRYLVKGLEEKPDGSLAEKGEHVAEISLLRGYPREAPVCRMLTPVFHPNIAPHVICIGDDWAAGESLVELIFRIGEMIAYQSYNTKSPLNGVAAKWCDENLDRLPLDATPLAVPTEAVAAFGAEAGKLGGTMPTCEKCQRPFDPAEHWQCPAGHVVCGRCRTVCLACGGPLCPVCEPHRCALCFQSFCSKCIARCPDCGLLFCPSHFDPAAGCCSRCSTRRRFAAPPPPQPVVAVPLIEFLCPGCQGKLQAQAQHAGMQITCPRCGGKCLIPRPGTGV